MSIHMSVYVVTAKADIPDSSLHSFYPILYQLPNFSLFWYIGPELV